MADYFLLRWVAGHVLAVAGYEWYGAVFRQQLQCSFNAFCICGNLGSDVLEVGHG